MKLKTNKPFLLINSMCEDWIAILFNYLKATKIEVGLLFNFGKRAVFKRKIFTNENKKFTIIE